MIRSFLAIELPENLKGIIASVINELRKIPSNIKWVSPENTHLTLKFFGSIPDERVEKISQTLLKVVPAYPRFKLSLKGLGAFPNLFRPRVIWADLGGEIEILQGFYHGLELALIPLGIPKEERPFHPHLTLGRNKLNQINEPLYKLLSGWSKEETASFEVQELIFFRSDLKPAGPVYTRLGVFPLEQNNVL